MDCSFEPNASYKQFIKQSYNFIYNYFLNIDQIENNVWFLFKLTLIDFLFIFLFIPIWAYSRKIYMISTNKFLSKYFNAKDDNLRRIKESLWNFIPDTFIWFFILFLIQENNQQCNIFHKPSQASIIIDAELPYKIKIFFWFLISKYAFSIYSVLYLDEKRKDFSVMFMHHIVTSILLLISYTTKTVNSTLLVILIHNVCDIFLVSAKISHYSQPKSYFGILLRKVLSFFFILFFSLTWFTNRLYLFPLRAIYYCSKHTISSSDSRIYGIGVLLLFVIFVMDVYWSYYLLKFLWRLIAFDRQIHDPTSKDLIIKKKLIGKNK